MSDYFISFDCILKALLFPSRRIGSMLEDSRTVRNDLWIKRCGDNRPSIIPALLEEVNMTFNMSGITLVVYRTWPNQRALLAHITLFASFFRIRKKTVGFSMVFPSWKKKFLPVSSAEIWKKLKTELKLCFFFTRSFKVSYSFLHFRFKVILCYVLSFIFQDVFFILKTKVELLNLNFVEFWIPYH